MPEHPRSLSHVHLPEGFFSAVLIWPNVLSLCSCVHIKTNKYFPPKVVLHLAACRVSIHILPLKRHSNLVSSFFLLQSLGSKYKAEKPYIKDLEVALKFRLQLCEFDMRFSDSIGFPTLFFFFFLWHKKRKTITFSFDKFKLWASVSISEVLYDTTGGSV